MRKQASTHLSGLGEFRNWKPEAQARALELLKQRERSPWAPFYCPDQLCDGHAHFDYDHTVVCGLPTHDWQRLESVWLCSKCRVIGRPRDEWTWEHARPDQRPPKWRDNWLALFFSGGRGSGKTRGGAEITHRVTNIVDRICLVAATGPDLRDTMVEGVSGLQATAPPGKMPQWEPSKKRLTWPNGCIAQGFSAEEPDRLRGPQFGYVWADEPAHYALIEAVWDNIMFGLRLKSKNGASAKVVATSTPKPSKWLKKTMAEATTIVHRVSTYANVQNLDEAFKTRILNKYEGTRIGRQELHGEVLEDVEGALWSWEMFQWIEEAPELLRIVVGVDPAGTANKKSDETGIIVVGIGHHQDIYVLDDGTGKYSPGVWASKSNGMYEDWSADAIVPEKNYGGDMVRFTLENAGYKGARIIEANSRRGKQIRAEPVVALYEKMRVYHVGNRGDLGALETELTEWVPGESDSPNRLDALVHAITELAKNIMPAAIANPNDLRPAGAVQNLPQRRHSGLYVVR